MANSPTRLHSPKNVIGHSTTTHQLYDLKKPDDKSDHVKHLQNNKLIEVRPYSKRGNDT